MARGFPLGGSCQRPRPLTDEGKACGSCLLRVCNGKPVPHPALRGHLPRGGKLRGSYYIWVPGKMQVGVSALQGAASPTPRRGLPQQPMDG